MSELTPYILWLPSWYPNKLGPFDGDFIQRHARAVSQFIPVHVLHLVRDKKGSVTKDVIIDENEEGDLKETIIYYYSDTWIPGFVEKIFSQKKYSRLYRSYLEELFQKEGNPALVHVHIAFKAGLIAMWLKKNFKLPYLITEQWTVYIENAKPGYNDLDFISRKLISDIYKNCELVLPVSEFLGKTLSKRWPFLRYTVVPNVVNTEIFYLGENENNRDLKLIHISTLTYQKDPQSLIKAAGILKRKGIIFSLEIIGPPVEDLVSLIKAEEVENEIVCLNEMLQAELVKHIRSSDALVLYSRYETFGCVIIEANACGVPVIVTDTSLMHELVENGINGLLVEGQSAGKLAEGLIKFSVIKSGYNKTEIANKTKVKYNYEVVGKQIFNIYKRYFKA